MSKGEWEKCQLTGISQDAYYFETEALTEPRSFFYTHQIKIGHKAIIWVTHQNLAIAGGEGRRSVTGESRRDNLFQFKTNQSSSSVYGPF